MSRFVVDASVTLKWVVPEPDSDAARALIGHHLLAPHWWLVEAGNGLWKAVGRRELTVNEASTRLAALAQAPVESIAAETLLEPALSFACDLGQPIYDCIYLALAIEQDLKVITADDRFRRALAPKPELLERIVMLKDWQA